MPPVPELLGPPNQDRSWSLLGFPQPGSCTGPARPPARDGETFLPRPPAHGSAPVFDVHRLRAHTRRDEVPWLGRRACFDVRHVEGILQ